MQLAVDEKVAFVLLAGDLYDGDWKDYNTGIYFIAKMGKLRDAGIPVFMVSGNHDAAAQITRSLKLPENVTLFPHAHAGSHTIDRYGVALHGQSFSTRSVTDDLLRNYPQGDPSLFNIGLLHTSLNGRSGHEPYAPCTLDALRSKGYQYWALGHVHQREEVSCDPWVVFPGNIQGRYIRETGSKGCSLVSVEDGRVVSVEQKELDVLRWAVCHIDAAGSDSIEHLLGLVRESLEDERVRADGRPLAARVVIEGVTTLHGRFYENALQLQQEFRAIAAGLGDVWIEKVVFNTRKPQGGAAVISGDSPVESLMKSIEAIQFETTSLIEFIPEFEKLRSKLPSELLNDGDPFRPGEDELAAIRQEVQELLTGKIQQRGHHEN